MQEAKNHTSLSAFSDCFSRRFKICSFFGMTSRVVHHFSFFFCCWLIIHHLSYKSLSISLSLSPTGENPTCRRPQRSRSRSSTLATIIQIQYTIFNHHAKQLVRQSFQFPTLVFLWFLAGESRSLSNLLTCFLNHWVAEV